jgi:hypothetical protein
MDNQLNLEGMNESELRDLENNMKNRRERLDTIAGSLGSWCDMQENNIFGSVLKHVDSQIAMAKADEDAHVETVSISVPSDEVRIGLRKLFHSRVLRSLRFNLSAAVILLFLPIFFDFLDSVQFLSPLSIAIYPIIAGILFLLVTITVIVRAILSRGKHKVRKYRDQFILAAKQAEEEVKGKEPGGREADPLASEIESFEESDPKVGKKVKPLWGWKRILLWLLGGAGFSALVAFWPVTGIFVKIFYQAPFFPSGWQIIGAALALFLFRFIFAIIDYYLNYRVLYFKPAISAWKAVNWASLGLTNTRHDRRRLEIVRQQIVTWHRIMGTLLRKPWVVDSNLALQNSNFEMASSFPPSIKVASALDSSSDDHIARNRLKKIETEILNHETVTGWRLAHFKKYLQDQEMMKDFTISAKAIAGELDDVTVGSSDALILEFERLIRDENFLRSIGAAKLRENLSDIQSKILHTGNLMVRTTHPSKPGGDVAEWDSHLRSVLVDQVARSNSSSLSNSSELAIENLQDWAFRKEARHSNDHTAKVFTYVSAPARLSGSLSNSRGYQNQIESSDQTADKSIELVLRMDIVGLTDFLSVRDLLMPEQSAATRRCPHCGEHGCARMAGTALDCLGVQ